MSPDALELRLEAEHERAIARIWDELVERGLGSQAQKPGKKIVPHVTVGFSTQMPPEVTERAQQLLPPLLPATLRRAGTVIFGAKKKQTVAWLLEAPEELEAAARDINALIPHGRGRRWVPHLTMGLRLPRDIVPEFISALHELSPPELCELNVHRAVLWQPRNDHLFGL